MANQQTKLDNTITGVRSNHNLSFNWLGSTDYGRIVPFHWQELVGTDKITKLHPKIEMQMLPIASPSFGKLSIYVHYFAVPIRLLWSNFNDWYSQTGKGKADTPPYWTGEDFYMADFIGDDNLDNFDQNNFSGSRGLYKHWTSFGLPPFWKYSSTASPGQQGTSGLNSTDKISLLPFRAYNQVWWDFYRDPELIPDDNKDFYIRTSGGRELNFDEDSSEMTAIRSNIYVPRVRSIKDVWFSQLFVNNGYSPLDYYTGDRKNDNNANIITSRDGLHSQQNRKIEALTRMAERLSLSGKRQIDMLFTQYGIKPEFSKLQMCQYIGGGKKDVLITDITATADTNLPAAGLEGAPLGQKAGQGYCQLEEIDINFTATEPTILLGVFSVMPKVHFVQGVGKEWYRNDRNDFFRKELEHVGQIAVPRKEIGVNYYGFDVGSGSSQRPEYVVGDNDKTFAFTQPYYEYKRKGDVLAGDFMFYHTKSSIDSANFDIAYMQSMGIYVDYPNSRDYNAENMLLPAASLNKLFFYQGGSVWDNVDDHFHVDIDVECIINRPMDGYAIPTLETTENPHAEKSPIGNSVQL